MRISCLVSYQILEFRDPASIQGGSHPANPERRGMNALQEDFCELQAKEELINYVSGNIKRELKENMKCDHFLKHSFMFFKNS